MSNDMINTIFWLMMILINYSVVGLCSLFIYLSEVTSETRPNL